MGSTKEFGDSEFVMSSEDLESVKRKLSDKLENTETDLAVKLERELSCLKHALKNVKK